MVSKFSGDCVERDTPVPIPNTAVKPLGADGTAPAAAWESRSSPDFYYLNLFRYRLTVFTEAMQRISA